MIDVAERVGVIERLTAGEAAAAIGDLADVLVDAVGGGAAVNFLADHSHGDAERFWRSQIPGIADGSRILLAARLAGRVVGTVVVTFAPQPNAPHRADVGKMLVHSSVRRQGIGARLLAAAEAAALDSGRTLLLLDTAAGSAGEALYRRAGWTEYGVVPDHSFLPAGVLAPTTFFYKRLGR